MSELTRDKVLAAVHPIDDATVAEIIATGIDHGDLVKACHFYAKDRANSTPSNIPPGRIGRWSRSWSVPRPRLRKAGSASSARPCSDGGRARRQRPPQPIRLTLR